MLVLVLGPVQAGTCQATDPKPSQAPLCCLQAWHAPPTSKSDTFTTCRKPCPGCGPASSRRQCPQQYRRRQQQQRRQPETGLQWSQQAPPWPSKQRQ